MNYCKLTQPTQAGVIILVSAFASAAQAQTPAKPPQAQAWIDIATFSGMGMPGGGGAMGAMGALGSLFGGGATKVTFPSTQTSSSGRVMDVTLSTRNNPQLAQGIHTIPNGLQLGPQLNLLAPQGARAAPERDEPYVDQPREKPKGRILLYWGCGPTIRAGQPRVLDMASLKPDDAARVFIARTATQRGVHSAHGRPHWPNPKEGQVLAENASLAGEHSFSASGVAPGFAFSLGQPNDVMPPLALASSDQGGATALEWNSLPTARGYFAGAIASKSEAETIIWSSSELPDTGFGLFDYQTNPAVDGWVKERVMLAPGTTRCAVPKGVLPGEGAMLRLIAYGPELNLVHPPRPADSRAAWEPQWAVKLRLKSMATAIAGMPSMGESMKAESNAPASESAGGSKPPGAVDLIRGLFGR